MDAVAKIAEERVRAAIENGEFDNLRNAGRPLEFEDDTWIPEDLRPAYRILKNSGYLPPEVEERREIMNLRELIDTIDDDKERLKKIRELNFKMLRMNLIRERPFYLEGFPDYEDRVVRRLTGGDKLT